MLLSAVELNFGGRSSGSMLLPHATAAKAMAMSFSLTAPWNTELWRSLYKLVLSPGGTEQAHQA